MATHTIFQYQALAGTPNFDAGAAPDPADFSNCIQAPYRRQVHRQANRAQGTAPSWALFTATQPTNPFGGQMLGIVPLDPSIDRRTRQHTQIVAEILNSLIGRGEIVRENPATSSWRIFAPAVVMANAAPTVNDDEGDGYMPGVIWINEGSSDVYICLNATAGAAVWFGPLL